VFCALAAGASFRDLPEFWAEGAKLFGMQSHQLTYFRDSPPMTTLLTLVPEASDALRILRAQLHLVGTIAACPALAEVLLETQPIEEILHAIECTLRGVFGLLADAVRLAARDADSACESQLSASQVAEALVNVEKTCASVSYFVEVAFPAYYCGVYRILSPLWTADRACSLFARSRVYAICSGVDLAFCLREPLLKLLKASLSVYVPGCFGDVTTATSPDDLPTAKMVSLLKHLSSLQANIRSAIPDILCRSLFTDIVVWILESERSAGSFAALFQAPAESDQPEEARFDCFRLIRAALEFFRLYFPSSAVGAKVDSIISELGCTAEELDKSVIHYLKSTVESFAGANLEVLTI